MLLTASCSLPRGAALQSEVLKESHSDIPTFQVVPVTRANLPMIGSWPETGRDETNGWLGTSSGPNTNVIEVGDMLDINIWDSQENSLITNTEEKSTTLSSVMVDADGSVFLPYVNEVHVRGLTPSAARARIQTKLEPIVPSAQVLVSMKQGRGNSVDLVGGVSSPGTYPMPSRDYKLLALISAGGGILNNLRNPRVRLLRGGATYEISAEELMKSGARNTLLRPGDSVIVEQDNHSFTALGAAGTEDLIYFPKDDLSALEAISLMRGLNDGRANPKGVLVLREYPVKALRSNGSAPNMQQVIFTFDLTNSDGLFAARKFGINPGDTVLATESPVTATQTIFSLFGSAVGFSRQVQNL